MNAPLPDSRPVFTGTDQLIKQQAAEIERLQMEIRRLQEEIQWIASGKAKAT